MNKTWYHATSWMTFGSPDDSLKVYIGLPRILESSLNQEYYHPEWPPKVLWDSTGNFDRWIDLKLSTWRRFVRIQRNIWGKTLKDPAYWRHWVSCVLIEEPKSPLFGRFYAHLGTFCTFWVQKKKKKYYNWHLMRDTCCVALDTKGLRILCQTSSSYCLGETLFWR